MPPQYLEAAEAGLVTRRGRPKRPATLQGDRGRINRHIVPLIGRMLAQDVDRAVIHRMMDAIATGKTAAVSKVKKHGKSIVRGGKGAATRTAETLGGIFSWAEGRGLVSGVNPARRIEKFRSEPSDRVLSPAEWARLGKVLHQHDHDRAAILIRLLAETGMRYSEGANLKWSEIDWQSSCLRLEVTKSGRSTRVIGKLPLELLSHIPRETEFVFPNAYKRAPAAQRIAVALLFDEADLPGVRSQVLRSAFASIGADMGFADSTISSLLGHAARGVTLKHYVRRSDPSLRVAADRISAVIARLLEGESGAVIALEAAGT
jgi:integrase